MDDFLAIDLLMEMGVISEEEAVEAQEMQRNATEDMRIIDCLEAMELISEDQFIQMIAQEYGMESFQLGDYRVPKDVLSMLPADIVQRYKVVPVLHNDDVLTIGITDPTDFETLDAVRYLMKDSDETQYLEVEAVVCKASDIRKVIDMSYSGDDDAVNAVIADITQSEIDLTAIQEADGLEEEDEETPIIRLVSMIIIEAYRMRASDIHLEPMEKRFRVRYRIDGALIEVDNPPKYLQNTIIQRLKIMSRLDITEKRVPQDGRINFRWPGKEIDLRVSTVPTVHGESIVMRILDKGSIMLGVAELGFYADDQERIDRILSMPDGIFLVTGPTGSGKTTSLYAFLNTINTPNRKIITAEDPVEYELQGINQVQCDKSIGMTFGLALRAMLRQAPNIIMVGEIRDIETGGIAINAALTGHLVFSTLHTNDAPGAVTRMIDMGVKPFLVASGVKAVMAQRLVRRNCKKCTQTVEPIEEELRLLELPNDYFDGVELKAGVGCGECNKGYKGRGGIYEIFMVGPEIVPMIFAAKPSDEIKARARELGMQTLRDDGLRKAAAGTTTLAEVIRVTKADDEEE